MEKETVTVKEAAAVLGIAPQGVRVQLQRGILPIGQAVPSVTGKGWRYLIFREKLNQYVGKGENK